MQTESISSLIHKPQENSFTPELIHMTTRYLFFSLQRFLCHFKVSCKLLSPISLLWQLTFKYFNRLLMTFQHLYGEKFWVSPTAHQTQEGLQPGFTKTWISNYYMHWISNNLPRNIRGNCLSLNQYTVVITTPFQPAWQLKERSKGRRPCLQLTCFCY